MRLEAADNPNGEGRKDKGSCKAVTEGDEVRGSRWRGSEDGEILCLTSIAYLMKLRYPIQDTQAGRESKDMRRPPNICSRTRRKT